LARTADSDVSDVVKRFSPRELEAFVYISQEIGKRTRYGLREETCERPVCTMMGWSNGNADWYMMGSRRMGDKVTLDANMIMVPYPRSLVENIKEALPPLPLYFCSFEAKQRGEVDPYEASLCWALKQLEKER